MAIGAVIRTAATAAKGLLKKKKLKEGLKKAINVTSDKASALKSTVNKSVNKVKDVYQSGLSENDVSAIRKKVYKAQQKIKPTVDKAKEKIKPAVDKVKKTASNLKEKAKNSFLSDTQVDGMGGGNIADLLGIEKDFQAGTFQSDIRRALNKTGISKVKNFIGRNPIMSGAIAGSLGTSILASAEKSSYMYKKLPDGDIEIKLLGGNTKSRFVSPKHIGSTKDIDDIRTNIAVLESIVTSDDPQKQKDRFRATVAYLNEKYGIHEITGKDLSIKLPKML